MPQTALVEPPQSPKQLRFRWPETSSSGTPRKSSLANFRAFTRSAGFEFRFNAFALAIEMRRGASRWIEITDAAEVDAWLQLTAAACDMPEKFFHACVVSEAHLRAYDPLVDWLDALPDWDGEQRVETLFIRNGGAPDVPIVRAMTRCWLVGAIKRAREPGAKFDNIMVLEGPQGHGKSSALGALVPDPGFFTDCLAVGDNPKITIEQTRGKWIVELAELAGFSRREISRTKAFASRTHDAARLAYDRHTKTVGRRFALAASFNPDASGQYFTDPTGSRRFWPIQITKKIDPEAIANERDQLWAEALALYADGERHWLTVEMETAARGLQSERTLDDPWEDLLAPHLEHRDRITIADLHGLLKLEAARTDAKMGQRLRNVMARLGFQKANRRSPGEKSGWCYVRGGPDA